MTGAVQIGAVGVAAALCALVLKKHTPELAFALALAAGCVLLSLALGWMEQLTAFLNELGDTAGLSPAVLSPVLKVTGIALVSRWAAALCRDAGEGAWRPSWRLRPPPWPCWCACPCCGRCWRPSRDCCNGVQGG